MLSLVIPKLEVFNDETNEFKVVAKEVNLSLEHSLISISKWESKYHRPFISDGPKTNEETLDYIKFMITNPAFDVNVLERLSSENVHTIMDYINDPMTATKFYNTNGGVNREIVTSELIYYWMVALQIPFECQKWHINRLITLIRVCNFKNSPQKKMSASDIASQNKMLNDARRKALHSKG